MIPWTDFDRALEEASFGASLVLPSSRESWKPASQDAPMTIELRSIQLRSFLASRISAETPL